MFVVGSYVSLDKDKGLDNIRYVSLDGNDNKDGRTWRTAKRTVAAAVKSLPQIGDGNFNRRYAGKVIVGPGTFDEYDVPIPVSAEIIIEGQGSRRTRIRLGNGANNHLIAPDPDYSDWGHHIVIRDVWLDGNRQNNEGDWDIVFVRSGGFNTSFYNVFVSNACRYGWHVRHAVNVFMYNVTGGNCTEAFMRFHIPPQANLATLGIYGAQIDNCGKDQAILVESETNGDANQLFIVGMETEASTTDYHDTIIRARVIGGTNTPIIHVQNANCWRAAPGGGEAVILEETGNFRWSIQNVRGPGYNTIFKSTNGTGMEFAGHNALGTNNPIHFFAGGPGKLHTIQPIMNAQYLGLNGKPISIVDSGDSSSRPTSSGYRPQGFCYFDTTLGKPIWWTGTKWIDATGADV